MNLQEVRNYLTENRDELNKRVGSAEVAQSILSLIANIITAYSTIAAIEAKKLDGLYTEEDARDVEHLHAQVMQYLDLIVNKAPTEVLGWLIHFLLGLIFRVARSV